MSKLTELQECSNKRELAKLLNIDFKHFSRVLYEKPIHERYTSFDIPKKNGGVRTIKSPNNFLKIFQKKLANLLTDCYEEIEKERISKFSKKIYFPSHGFRRNFSAEISKSSHNSSEKYFENFTFDIYSNAKIHINKRYVFNIDLENFFETFTFNRIVGCFLKNSHFQLEKEVAITIAQIATFRNQETIQGYLPQGSPCSPVITNLMMGFLDSRLIKLAKENNCLYSRYADDITFSSNLKNFPIDISKLENNQWQVGNVLLNEILNSGFSINIKKTRMALNYQRQQVTGLVVNKKLNISSDYYRATRCMVHTYCCTGEYSKSPIHVFHNPQKTNIQSLNGVLNYIYQVKKTDVVKLIPELNCGLDSTKTEIINKNKQIKKLDITMIF